MTQLPNATPGQIMGLLEILDDYKGRADAARIAADFDLDLDELLPSVEGAELLGFCSTAHGDVIVTDVGRKMLKASLKVRKTIFREQVLKTVIVQEILLKLKKAGGRLGRDDLAEILGFKLWTHDVEPALKTLIGWGRQATLFSYDADRRELVLVP
ncbi:MAG: AAA-associated domain-containing protein [Thermoplasmatota archaeon]